MTAREVGDDGRVIAVAARWGHWLKKGTAVFVINVGWTGDRSGAMYR
jgi:hypothetical protein